MSTNYYVTFRKNGKDNEIHIGKRSFGMKFLFAENQQAKLLNSWKRWQNFLRNGNKTIKDEYGATIPFETFVKTVEARQREGMTYQDQDRYHPDPSYYRPPANTMETFDADGYRFSTSRDFS